MGKQLKYLLLLFILFTKLWTIIKRKNKIMPSGMKTFG